MTQKTLNKMVKYCKLTSWRFGQLVSNLVPDDGGMGLFYMDDSELERRFNKLWLENTPVKKRGHYYKK